MAVAPRPEDTGPSVGGNRLFTLVMGGHPGPPAGDEQRATLDEVARWGMKRQLRSHAFHYREARAVSRDLAQLYNPFKTAMFLRLLARRRCWLEDDHGARRQVTAAYLTRLAGTFIVDKARAGRTLREAARQVDRLAQDLECRSINERCARAGDGPPLYLRTDLIFDVEAGGAVAHISGVVNNLRFRGLRPTMATTAPIPLVDSALETHVVPPEPARAASDEVWRLGFNQYARLEVTRLLAGRRPAFIYQRANAYSYLGTMLGQDLGVPLVVEYNGSDAWISRHWGHQPIRREDLVLKIEDLNLRASLLVVVVSEALATELAGRGVPRERILVVPNGVDTDRFHPAIDGLPTRVRYGIGPEETVLGFVGSFGPWHGAEVLAEAFALIARQRPCPERLLMVGEGSRLPAVRSIVEKARLAGRVVFTGLVPQEEGPAHMAACDVLVAPHVPNPDGSAFFGSPTKLFEYLAMGKAVVASDLDQLGDVITDDVNGLLVPPGDPGRLAEAMTWVALDAGLRARLGAQARRDAVERHTWRQHADVIAARLEELLLR